MDNILAIEDWIKANQDLVDLPDRSIATQLGELDKSNTGVGFIFYLTPIGESDQNIQLDMTANPVMKVQGVWYVIVDENLAEIFKAILRMTLPRS